MKFHHSTEKDITLIHLKNEKGILFTIAPDFGAKLCSLRLESERGLHQLLWEVSADDLLSNNWYKSTILFPYPNRLENGRYSFEGKTYQFPINEPDKNNQLHGMVYNAPFDILDQNEGADHAEITCVHKYDGSEAYFPFPFELLVTYRYQSNEFQVHFTVKNTGRSGMPFGLGWHPYFQMDGNPITDYRIHLPETVLSELNDRSIPTGKESPYPDREINLDATKLDNGFKITDGKLEYALTDLKSKLKLFMKASEGFDYLQIFTPPGDESVAIEPMTCNVNAFNNQQGLKVLKPSEEFKGTFQMALSGN